MTLFQTRMAERGGCVGPRRRPSTGSPGILNAVLLRNASQNAELAPPVHVSARVLGDSSEGSNAGSSAPPGPSSSRFHPTPTSGGGGGNLRRGTRHASARAPRRGASVECSSTVSDSKGRVLSAVFLEQEMESSGEESGALFGVFLQRQGAGRRWSLPRIHESERFDLCSETAPVVFLFSPKRHHSETGVFSVSLLVSMVRHMHSGLACSRTPARTT